MSLVDRYTAKLLADLRADVAMGDAMRDLTFAHADRLRELGPVRVRTLDPCPQCGSRVVAGDRTARCVSCDWSWSVVL